MEIAFFFSWLWLLGAHLWGLYLGRHEPFVRNPVGIAIGLSLLKTWPYSLVSYIHPAVVDYRVVNSVGLPHLGETIVAFNFLYGIFICFFVLTLLATRAYRSQRTLLRKAEQLLQLRGVRSSEVMAAAFLALALFTTKWVVVGGLSFSLLSDELDRGVGSAGIGYIVGPADLALSFASLLALMRFRVTAHRRDLLLFLAMLVLAMFSFSLFGGRKTLLQHLIICVVVWNLAGGRFELVSRRSVVLLAFGLFYFISILYLRLPDAQRDILFRDHQVPVFGPVLIFLANFSYNDTYYFLIDYSTRFRLFLGAAFFDLFSALLPSTLWPDKPPVDDGVYVKALVDGVTVFPPAPAARFVGYGSWPPETFGTFVLNFGVWSVWLGGVLFGAIVSLGLLVVRKLGVGFLGIYLVFHSALNFQLSNLRIVNLLTVIAFGSVILLIIRLPSLFRRLAGRRPALGSRVREWLAVDEDDASTRLR